MTISCVLYSNDFNIIHWEKMHKLKSHVWKLTLCPWSVTIVCVYFLWGMVIQKFWDIPFLLKDYESKQKLSLILNFFIFYSFYQSQEMEFTIFYSEWNYFVTVSFYQFPSESPYSPSCFLCLWLSTLLHTPPCKFTTMLESHHTPFPCLAQGRL